MVCCLGVDYRQQGSEESTLRGFLGELLIFNLGAPKSQRFCDLRLRCPSRTPEIARFLRQEKAMLHCDLRVRWKVASDLRFRAAISESKTPSVCRISGDLAPSARKSLAIAIVQCWCAMFSTQLGKFGRWAVIQERKSSPKRELFRGDVP